MHKELLTYLILAAIVSGVIYFTNKDEAEFQEYATRNHCREDNSSILNEGTRTFKCDHGVTIQRSK